MEKNGVERGKIMRVFNKAKTKELNEYDLTKGYLKEDTIINNIPAIEEVKEQGHYEVIKEYPNGGKDVEWVIDVKGVKGQEARDEEEAIYCYIPYTKKELTKIKNQNRINELKQLLKETDYRAIKYAEGCYTEEEYKPYKELRQSYRDEINELEQEIGE